MDSLEKVNKLIKLHAEKKKLLEELKERITQDICNHVIIEKVVDHNYIIIDLETNNDATNHSHRLNLEDCIRWLSLRNKTYYIKYLSGYISTVINQ